MVRIKISVAITLTAAVAAIAPVVALPLEPTTSTSFIRLGLAHRIQHHDESKAYAEAYFRQYPYAPRDTREAEQWRQNDPARWSVWEKHLDSEVRTSAH